MYVTGKRLRNKLSDDHQPKINSSTGDLLDTTTNHKLLGVYVDQDLSFQKHIDYICKKLSQRIGLLRSIKHYLPFTERVLFYNAIIKPILMYGGSVWGSTSKDNIKRVFKLQKRAASVILDAKTKETRTVRLFEKLGWLPFYQITRVSDISKRSSRHGNITLRCPKYSRETEGGRTFLISTIKLWNTLPVDIRSSNSIRAFKQNCFEFFKNSYVEIDHFCMS